MKDTYVSFETAILAKEKGFNYTCNAYYFEDGEFKINKLKEYIGDSGFYFFELYKIKLCRDPPKYLHIPLGKGYRHICPTCGEVIIISTPQISF